MSAIASRAGATGARLVSHALGATASKYDVSGRQSAVDYLLTWPDGRTGALEITLVTRAESSAWPGVAAAAEGWRWPASSASEFRLAGADMPYRQTWGVVLHAVELCEQ